MPSFQSVICSLFTFYAVPIWASALQHPFNDQSPLSNSLNTTPNEWDLEVGPNPNATGIVMASSTFLFLCLQTEGWSSTGHNLVPGTVPPGTLLYHGRSDDQMPKNPEWCAVDPEHSYMFCRTRQPGTGCWHLTLATTRPLKVLYFDGSGAAKMEDGSMDTQDMIAWGKIMPEKFFQERERIKALCDWGQRFEVDGFVRMEMDFEIMLCDFTKGVEVVSFLELRSRNRRFPGGPRHGSDNPSPASPIYHEHPPPMPHPPPPGVDFGSPSSSSFPPGPGRPEGRFDEALNSGSWHSRFPGETRIKLDLTRLVSFYDTSLVPSLVDVRFGKPRLEHRVLGASEEDLKRVINKVEEMLTEEDVISTGSNGVDWRALFHVLVDRYGNRLEVVRYLLNLTDTNAFDSDENDEDKEYLVRAKSVQEQLDIMLRPYLIYSAVPPSPNSDSLSWASPIFKLCATTHTRYISSQSLTPSETLLNAFQETNREICRVITRMWIRGVVDGGLNDELSPNPREKAQAEDGDGDDEDDNNVPLKSLLTTWRQEIDTLMSWLDWSVWLRCRPECGFDEFCYLPTWPYFRRGEDQDWKDPQPKCIPRLQA
ncbi:hypothetical protein D9758_012296 [Tetrapyrgos nigripes]|uniref:Uncharacterized protein n=1 Tax=Tetrapyrgos nigripes TaxID=182062 RepID=A0A8H5CGL2_9AGAR|nr:hypothetical protein D9758_012296 [Tetrapyrgos nigripes]